MESQVYQLEITNDKGFVFKKNISEAVCNRIVLLTTQNIYSSVNEPQDSSDISTSPSKSEPSGKKALNEYCQSFNPKNNRERITAIAMYLNEFEKSELKRNDVQIYFARAGFSKPKNPGRDLRDTISDGWISASPKNEDEFYPTDKGKKYMSAKKSK